MRKTSHTNGLSSYAILARLEETIRTRHAATPETSYTAKLLSMGASYCARKFGEEAIETVLAAAGEPDDALVGEAADTLFHLMVLLSARGLSLEAVMAELARREGVSGHEEKARRAQD